MISMRATGHRLCAFVVTVLAAGCGGKVPGGGGAGGGGERSGSGAPEQAADTNGAAGASGAAAAPAPDDAGAATGAGLPSVAVSGGGAAPVFVGSSPSSTPQAPPPSQAQLVTLAGGQTCPWGMAIDATSVYWTDCGDPTGGTVQKVPKTGGAIVTLASGDVLSGITVEGSNVYWVARTADESGAIKTVPVAGGTPMVVAAQSGAPSHIVADASYVYWGELNGGGVMKAPLGGGAVTMVAPATLAFQIALGDTAVFWMDAPGLMTAPKTGGAPMSLAPAFGPPLPTGGIAVDATTVYFSTGRPNAAGISDVPIDGGAVSPVASTPASNGSGPVAIDATRVYWADMSGAVYAAPLSGGTATLLAIGQDNVDAIAVDDSAVYWLVNGNGSPGGVMELPLSAVEPTP